MSLEGLQVASDRAVVAACHGARGAAVRSRRQRVLDRAMRQRAEQRACVVVVDPRRHQHATGRGERRGEGVAGQHRGDVREGTGGLRQGHRAETEPHGQIRRHPLGAGTGARDADGDVVELGGVDAVEGLQRVRTNRRGELPSAARGVAPDSVPSQTSSATPAATSATARSGTARMTISASPVGGTVRPSEAGRPRPIRR